MSFSLEAARRKAERYSVSLTRDELLAACDEVERLTKERDEAVAEAKGWNRDATVYAEAYEEAMALLRDLEWRGGEDVDECPCCQYYPGEHTDDCRLAALLKEHK